MRDIIRALICCDITRGHATLRYEMAALSADMRVISHAADYCCCVDYFFATTLLITLLLRRRRADIISPAAAIHTP